MSNKSKPPENAPPAHLGVAGAKFWTDIHQLYQLEAPDMQRLVIACDCLDRIAQANAILAKGLDRMALSAWRDASKLFLSSVRQMGVDIQQTASGKLPAIHQPNRRAS